MKRALGLGLLLLAAGMSIAAAQLYVEQRPPLATIERVRGNLYYIGGADPLQRETFTGGSTAVFVTDSGVVIVDTKTAGFGRGILEQVKSVTDKQVTMVINTHTHFDHTGSNTEFPSTVTFVAHENTKANLSKQTCTPITNCEAFRGPNARYLPTVTFEDRMSLLSGKDRIDLYYFGRGHTDGDAWVVFPAVRAAMADFFPRKGLPFLDPDNGGSGIAFADTVERAAASLKNVDTIIPGHSSPLPIVALGEFAEFYRDFLDTVQAGVAAGKTVQEIVDAYRIPEKYKDYTYDRQRTLDDVQIIFEEMTRETAQAENSGTRATPTIGSER